MLGVCDLKTHPFFYGFTGFTQDGEYAFNYIFLRLQIQLKKRGAVTAQGNESLPFSI